MNKIKLTRINNSDEGTTGVLTFPSGEIHCTLELPPRLNAERLSRIPAGVYTVRNEYSLRFGRLVLTLQNVPNRSHILIHHGNFAGDVKKGWKSDVEGCILIGKRHRQITPAGFERPQLAVTASPMRSSDYLFLVESVLAKIAKNGDILLEIIDEC